MNSNLANKKPFIHSLLQIDLRLASGWAAGNVLVTVEMSDVSEIVLARGASSTVFVSVEQKQNNI